MLFYDDRSFVCLTFLMFTIVLLCFACDDGILAFRILIPTKMIKVVLGKGGSTIHEIQESTNTKYEME